MKNSNNMLNLLGHCNIIILWDKFLNNHKERRLLDARSDKGYWKFKN
jgi:hypothetical protein